VVGSVSGDDTVFIACRDVSARRRVKARIVELAG
jgi:arginine repressor